MELNFFPRICSKYNATNYNNAYMEHYNCANFKVVCSRKAFLHLTRQQQCVYLLINNS